MQSSQGEEERRRRRRAKVNKIKIYLSKVLKMSRDNLAWKTCPRICISVHRKRVLWMRSESAGRAALWDSKKFPGRSSLQKPPLEATELSTVLVAALVIQPTNHKKEIKKKERTRKEGCHTVSVGSHKSIFLQVAWPMPVGLQGVKRCDWLLPSLWAGTCHPAAAPPDKHSLPAACCAAYTPAPLGPRL